MPPTDDQHEVFPTRLKLRRNDPVRNMCRFYLMQVQPDLFGGVSLIREWGRIGSGGRTLVEHHADEGTAITSLLRMARTKARRGYDDGF
ncbi:WGR domain-containing protein [uncultured Jannaschia sp.]|uniref:WGR domain-containing protein n=1 Tax=uncultured Jannaschia sp. TaxID=293347 RepID=UPI002627E213|nr:WGR domain-containing protein [uncultured Jannaschia sp.]